MEKGSDAEGPQFQVCGYFESLLHQLENFIRRQRQRPRIISLNQSPHQNCKSRLIRKPNKRRRFQLTDESKSFHLLAGLQHGGEDEIVGGNVEMGSVGWAELGVECEEVGGGVLVGVPSQSSIQSTSTFFM